MKNKRDICVLIGEQGSGKDIIIKNLSLDDKKYKVININTVNSKIYKKIKVNSSNIVSDLGKIIPLENRKEINYIKKIDLEKNRKIKLISASPQMVLNLVKDGYSERMVVIRVFKPLESRILNIYDDNLSIKDKAKKLDDIINSVKIFENIDNLEFNKEMKYSKVYNFDDDDILDILDIIKYYTR